MNTESTPSPTTPIRSHIDTLTHFMVAAWAGEPLPEVGSPELAQFEAAMLAVVGQARPFELQRLGCAAAKALLDFRRNGLEAQRATALAQLAARGGLH
jgi:hypothetical protein